MTHARTGGRSPWCIAHRGAREEAPENTRSAFERALAYPIDGIELDVQMSADGTAIVHHDPTLKRITGRQVRVSGRTREQLERLDWGKWFHPSFTGEPLNTLAQTLTLFGSRTRLLIEIKSSPSDRKSGRTDRLTRQVASLLADMPEGIPRTNIYVLSFDLGVLQLAYRLAPQWRYVLNVPERDPDKIMGVAGQTLRRLWAVDVRIDRLSEAWVAWAKSMELRVFTYTCNHARQVRKALRLEVDAILSDRPGCLVHYVDDAGSSVSSK